MNMMRLAFLILGAGLILTALAVAYYNTGLRNDVPEGAAIATLIGVTGLFALAFSQEFRRDRLRTVEHVEHHERARPPRPTYMGTAHNVDESETHEEIRTIRKD